jgi:hypothetical protein
MVNEPRGHGTRRIELLGDAESAVAGIEPVQNGWNAFSGLDLASQRLRLKFTALPGKAYITCSEIEVWGEETQ